MGTLSRPYIFQAGTDAVAAQVNADLDTLYNWVNGGSGMWADGSVAFSGIPLAPNTDPTNINHLVRKRYSDNHLVGSTVAAGTLATGPVNFKLQAGFGVYAVDASSKTGVITFPAPFAGGVFAVLGNVDATNANQPGGYVQPFNVTATGCQFWVWGILGAPPNVIGQASDGHGHAHIHWLAIGY